MKLETPVRNSPVGAQQTSGSWGNMSAWRLEKKLRWYLKPGDGVRPSREWVCVEKRTDSWTNGLKPLTKAMRSSILLMKSSRLTEGKDVPKLTQQVLRQIWDEPFVLSPSLLCTQQLEGSFVYKKVIFKFWTLW
jgi:hypothetical protein